MTAAERRTAVLAAAITEFARSGYAGTSTDAIATRAGISQPYLFRLFGTKKDLFVATYDLVADRIIAAMTRAGQGLDGHEALEAMGLAYAELLQDPELLQVQLHGFAAAPGDPDIAASCRRTFEVLWQLVHERTHLSEDEILEFFAMGMMMNVMSAIDLLSIPEHGPRACASARRRSRHPGHDPEPSRTSASPSQDTDHGGIRMNQPFTVPLFLPRRVSEHSQSNRRGATRRTPWAPDQGLERPHRPVPVRPSPDLRLPQCGHARRRSGQGPERRARIGRIGRRGPAYRVDRPAAGISGAGEARWRAVWAVVITGLALFMASLDNLVVSTALPVIRVHLHAGLSGLEWTVNAYTLTFAVLLLPAAALGERFGRRRIFVAGIALFTAASAVAALAPSIAVLIAARALQGGGRGDDHAAVADPAQRGRPARAPQRRPRHVGRHRRRGRRHRPAGRRRGHQRLGLAVHLLAQRARRAGAACPWPGGGWPSPGATPPPSTWSGWVWSALGLFGVVLGLVRGNAHGWTPHRRCSPRSWSASAALAAFVAWELRSDHPMLDIRLFPHRGFAAVNVTAMLFSFGMFGSIFFLTPVPPDGAGLLALWRPASGSCRGRP